MKSERKFESKINTKPRVIKMVKTHFFEISGWFDAKYDPSKHFKRKTDTSLDNKWDIGFVSITVAKRILDKKPNMIDLLAEELIKFGIEEWTIKKLKQRVEFGIEKHDYSYILNPIERNKKIYEYTSTFRKYLVDCINEKWNKMFVFETNTLQALLMQKLKNTEFRFKAAVYHTQNHGAQDTLDLIDLIDREWSLRY